MKLNITFRIIILCLLVYASFLQAQKIEWTKTSGPAGIHVSSFAKDSTGVLYAAEQNALYKSKDAGITWTRMKDFLNNVGKSNIIDQMVIEYGDNLLVHCVDSTWHRTTDYGISWNTVDEFIPFITNSNGSKFRVDKEVYKFTNQGNTWENISPYPLGYFSSIIIDSDNRLFVGGKYGLIISEDGGLTWSQNLGGYYVKVLHASRNNTIYIYKQNSVLKSSDHGKTWLKIFSAHFDGYEEKSSIQFTEEGELLYNRIGDFRYFLFSKDNFSTYTTVKTIPANIQIKAFLFSGKYILVSYANPGGIHRTSDLGLTWKVFENYGYYDVIVNSISISKDKIYISTDKEGVFKSTDFGKSWQKMGLENISIYSSDKDLNGNLFVGAYNLIGGIFSTYNDSVFIRINNGLKTIYDNITAIKCIGKSYLLASGWWAEENNLYRSSDSGNTWTILPYAGGFYQIAVDKHNRIYCPNRESIIYSDDYGETWNKTNFNVWRALSLG